MNRKTEICLLQTCVAVASLVPVAAGLQGVVESAAMLRGVEPPLPPDLGSHFRYLSGLLLGIGLGFVACIPRIAERSVMFRLLGFVVIVGGLGRLAGLALDGAPGPAHVAALGMELGVVPLLLLWQGRVAKS